MSRLPDEWERVPVYFSVDIEYQHREHKGSVVIYSENQGEWIRSNVAFDL